MEIRGRTTFCLLLHSNAENLLSFATLIKKRQMKLFATILILLVFAACGPSAQDREVRESARQSLLDQNASLANSAPANQLPAAAAVNTSVSHYICPNNCEGSGGASEGTCPVCNSAYVHNQDYHTTPAAATPTTTPEPPQNAAGVWHYTCSNGCEGGAGSAIACATCGATLVHNTLYHN